MGKIADRAFVFSGYRFDSRTGELKRNGRRLRIPAQTARLLALLLENQGTMVTRDQVKLALWPKGEILEYDQSINRAVSQLRSILRNPTSKDSPLIETLPKRGYRLTALVEEITETTEAEETGETLSELSPALVPFSSVAADETFKLSSSLPAPITIHEVSALAPLPSPPQVSRARLWFWAFGLVLLTMLGGALWRAYARRPTPLHSISLGIVPFESSGENANALAESFRLNLADVLSQSPEIEPRAVHSF